MTSVLWTLAALAAGLIATAAGMWSVRNAMGGMQRGNHEEKVPLTPLQRSALWALAVGVAITAAVVSILAVAGPTKAGNDPVVRVTMEILPVAGLAAYLFLMMRLRSGKGRVLLDERDRAILERAPIVQAQALVVLIAAWAVILTEAYWTAGQVPVVFLTLIFWSSLLVSMMALPVGILVGYRRS
jgi:hypothetical protein